MSGTACTFFNVMLLTALVVVIACPANDKLAGVNVAGFVPVPDYATVCGVLGALSFTISVPLNGPTLVGVKVT